MDFATTAHFLCRKLCLFSPQSPSELRDRFNFGETVSDLPPDEIEASEPASRRPAQLPSAQPFSIQPYPTQLRPAQTFTDQSRPVKRRPTQPKAEGDSSDPATAVKRRPILPKAEGDSTDPATDKKRPPMSTPIRAAQPNTTLPNSVGDQDNLTTEWLNKHTHPNTHPDTRAHSDINASPNTASRPNSPTLSDNPSGHAHSSCPTTPTHSDSPGGHARNSRPNTPTHAYTPGDAPGSRPAGLNRTQSWSSPGSPRLLSVSDISASSTDSVLVLSPKSDVVTRPDLPLFTHHQRALEARDATSDAATPTRRPRRRRTQSGSDILSPQNHPQRDSDTKRASSTSTSTSTSANTVLEYVRSDPWEEPAGYYLVSPADSSRLNFGLIDLRIHSSCSGAKEWPRFPKYIPIDARKPSLVPPCLHNQVRPSACNTDATSVSLPSWDSAVGP